MTEVRNQAHPDSCNFLLLSFCLTQIGSDSPRKESSIRMFRSSTSNFDRLLDKATSQLLLEPDWSSTLALTDLIRGGEVPPKYAVSAIKKRFYSDNPHVALFALEVTPYDAKCV